MIDWRDSEQSVNSFAYRVGRRITAAGAPAYLVEDVKQELWIAWCLARDSYNPERGASFKTFLFNGMRQHINRWVDYNVSRRHGEVIAYSLDYEMESESGSMTLQEVVASDEALPDEELMDADSWEFALRLLPPKARKFAELLKDPPESLFDELRRVQAKGEYARSQGFSMGVANHVTSSMIFDVLGVSRVERSQITKVIRKVGLKMQRIER